MRRTKVGDLRGYWQLRGAGGWLLCMAKTVSALTPLHRGCGPEREPGWRTFVPPGAASCEAVARRGGTQRAGQCQLPGASDDRAAHFLPRAAKALSALIGWHRALGCWLSCACLPGAGLSGKSARITGPLLCDSNHAQGQLPLPSNCSPDLSSSHLRKPVRSLLISF